MLTVAGSDAADAGSARATFAVGAGVAVAGAAGCVRIEGASGGGAALAGASGGAGSFAHAASSVAANSSVQVFIRTAACAGN
jgi:hypothetical protein